MDYRSMLSIEATNGVGTELMKICWNCKVLETKSYLCCHNFLFGLTSNKLPSNGSQIDALCWPGQKKIVPCPYVAHFCDLARITWIQVCLLVARSIDRSVSRVVFLTFSKTSIWFVLCSKRKSKKCVFLSHPGGPSKIVKFSRIQK